VNDRGSARYPTSWCWWRRTKYGFRQDDKLMVSVMSGDTAFSQDHSYDLFIAAAMSALNSQDYATGRESILAVMTRLSKSHGFARIYFAGAAIAGSEDFTSASDALRNDLEALRNSKLFVLVYPTKLVTSALVEAGYALALRLPCLFLVRDKTDLPYLLNRAESGDAGDLLPPIKIGTFSSPVESAEQIAAFRNEMVDRECNRG
jgi:hypothetical protein